MDTPDEVTIWRPADILSPLHSNDKQFAIVVLNQPMGLPQNLYTHLWSNAKYKIGADGGANCLYAQNMKLPHRNQDLDLNLVIGDLDSVTTETEKYWKDKHTPIILDTDQYSTDFTKAVRRIQSEFSQPTDIIAIGGLGGRVDQGLSVLHHLYMFQKEPGYPSGKMFLLSSEAITFVLKSGKHKIKAKQLFDWGGLDKHIGIIPLKEPSLISTEGLEWDIKDWKTEFGGNISTSNHVVEEWITIETTKDVLFTIDLKILNIENKVAK